MWDLPGPGIEPVSPALAGGFLTTVPPGKSGTLCFLIMRKSGKCKGWLAEESGDLSFVAGGVGGSRMGMDGRKRRKLVDTDKDSLPDQTLVRLL